MADAAGSPERTRAGRSEARPSDTGTNVQEAGVDEPDVVKTDGSLLVRVVDDSTLVVYDVTGDEPVRLGSLPLDGMFSPELLLAGDRVVVIGRDPGAAQGRIAPGTTVLVVDIADPSVAHGGARGVVRLLPRHRAPARRRGPARGLGRACPTWTSSSPGLFRREATALEKQPGRRPGEHHRRLAAARDDDRAPTARSASSSSAARTSRSRPSTPGLGTVAVVGFDVDDPASTRRRRP